MTTSEMYDKLDDPDVHPDADVVLDLTVFGMGKRHITDVHTHEETGSAVLVVGERAITL